MTEVTRDESDRRRSLSLPRRKISLPPMKWFGIGNGESERDRRFSLQSSFSRWSQKGKKLTRQQTVDIASITPLQVHFCQIE